MSHDHHNHCDHEMAYCARCDVAYCRKCSREWGRHYWTNPSPWYPYTITWQGTGTGLTQGTTTTDSTASATPTTAHNHHEA
jgi:hypothetical protein